MLSHLAEAGRARGMTEPEIEQDLRAEIDSIRERCRHPVG